MKRKACYLLATMALGLSLAVQPNMASAESGGFSRLSAQWWQWALSIPTSNNPLLDTTGEKCMIGQRGPTWFLGGVFGGGGMVTRNCTVPDNVSLFFPVINSVNFNSPNICEFGPDDQSVAVLRRDAAPFIEGSINLLVEVDGNRVKHLRRVQSKVFALTLPEDNLFDAFCAVPGGVYSPSIDDGVYVHLGALKPGAHVVHIHAENPSATFVLDVTYMLNVQHVSLK